MIQKQIGENTGNSGRINVSGSELQKPGAEFGDAVEVEVAASADIARALVNSEDEYAFHIVTPD